MTKEHKQAHLLRHAADNADASFISTGFGERQTISWVASYPDYDWRIYTPPKPDIVTYHEFFATGALSGNYRDLASAKEFKSNSAELLAYIKTTINGETGKITAEVIVP
jgi:hypothetical protein